MEMEKEKMEKETKGEEEGGRRRKKIPHKKCDYSW